MSALYDGDGYKGFKFNVEMDGGRFVPSYHDPLIHAKDSWVKLSKCVADTTEAALAKARKHIDGLIAEQLDKIEGHVKERFKRPLA